ncbi:hypothetical protein FB554_2800 [Barrientosiimonas humi]|uniref:Uncharacterized protein n=2 Tax=Barrientosiimonas TaxID=1535207 RepID=A0A542XFM1_9MICO|nr:MULTISPECIES: hypothetical protein [Barrientosiimonas]TQL34624.1 hypothetical protein FB554_2800 [Barrientosiimonas humi]BDZ59733.1 hypothetical protein GCM10025872_33900 [Barrientosiimonas endolithica]CAG7574614.1 hypothetical protein BH39T_PBIAJDOK_03270 [Barrientosiimonas humi]
MTLAKTIRTRRQLARNRRALAQAISDASSPSMRADLIAAAQRQGF